MEKHREKKHLSLKPELHARTAVTHGKFNTLRIIREAKNFPDFFILGIDNFARALYIINIKIASAIFEGGVKVSPLKKGQKLTENPKNVSLNLRLTKSEAEDIQYCADKLKTSRTNVINMGVQKVKAEIDKK